jgi:hypothetical protein
MPKTVTFPAKDQQLLQAQQKRAELITKRDRLNKRIAALTDYIEHYFERQEARRKFWGRFNASNNET